MIEPWLAKKDVEVDIYFHVLFRCHGSRRFGLDPPSTSLRAGFDFGEYAFAQDLHDPGTPPQRPQVGGASLLDADLPLALLTANTLSFRAVLDEPHSGHLGLGPSDIVFCRCSKPFSHD